MKFFRFLVLLVAAALVYTSLATHAPPSRAASRFLGNIYYGGREPVNFSRYWNQVTPENDGKWGSVERSRDVYSWAGVDSAYNYARSRGYPFKFHNFVWGTQQPSWITSLSAADQRAEVEEWIRDVCQRYPDMEMIDVVNEPLHDQPSYKNALGGDGSTGWDWVIWTYQTARRHCGSAKLLLNDYGILNNDSATTQYINLVNILKSRGLLDEVAEEGHGFENIPLSTLRNNLNRLAATGLPIHLSEYEAAVANDSQQLQLFQQQIPLFWEHPSVVGVTLWGYVQGQHWKPDGYLLRSDGSERPALTWLMNYVRGTRTPTPVGPTPTRTPTPVGPTATPTRIPTATPVGPTPTPGTGGTCSPVTSTITSPFTYDGAGTFCWRTNRMGSYINSWNLSSLRVNGVDYTNRWANSFPAAIDGYWYISYSGQYGWSHFEIR
ncbi:MAG TPA: endo-1,4-beta-xylanase [Roseiflexaceae bacterium]|nr:endo-1,4-beta-xylanase [Roseiflexaceae bacterium]